MNIQIIGRDIQIDQTAFIAVENDNATEIATFVLDRYTDSGIDLSDMSGFIIYSNALGTRFEALETTLIEDKLNCKWTVTRPVTTVNGRFLFCLTFISSKNYEGIADAERVWSTAIAKSNITGSLVGDDYAVPEEPLIVQMLELAGGIVANAKDVKANADRAEIAQSAADMARQEAVLAQSAADTARLGAVSAQSAADTARQEAVSAQTDAQEAATRAAASAQTVVAAVDDAQQLVTQAQTLITQLSTTVDQINGGVI